MSEWKECKLGDVCIFQEGYVNPSQKIGHYFGDEIKWLRANDLNNSYVYDTSRKLSREGFDSAGKSAKLFKPNTIAISKSGTIGRVGILKDFMCGNRAVINIEPNNQTDYQYIFYILKMNSEAFQHMAVGSVQPNLYVSALQGLEFLLPPLPEQRAIASVLSSLDDKIDLLRRENQTLEAMAETLFRQWFVEEADKGWEAVRVGDFVKTNILSIDKNFEHKTIRYLDTGSLTEDKIESYQKYEIADAPSRARRIVRHNDILISTVRPNQKHYGIIKHPDEDIIVSTGFCVITCDKINPHFIYMLLTTEEMTEYLHSIAEGSTSTYPSLKPSDIENIEFLLPPNEMLNIFSEYADSVWNKIDYNHIQICTLEKLRDTLLPKLMSGEVRVKINKEILPITPNIIDISTHKNKRQKASDEFVEAVLIAQLVRNFSDAQHPLGRMRYNKLAYFAHRKTEDDVTRHYLKQPAGPYNPWAKYQGPEDIAISKGYVKRVKTTQYEGLGIGDKIDSIDQYLSRYPVCNAVKWVADHFRFKKNEELELLATVDFAAIDLRTHNKVIDVDNIKIVIEENKNWAPKLDRSIFSDENIQKAILELENIFPITYIED